MVSATDFANRGCGVQLVKRGPSVFPLVALSVLATILAGCQLDEVTISSGEPMVVVSAVMRPDTEYQYVIVEQSLSGALDGFEPENVPVPNQAPRIPIGDATVTVENVDLPGDVCGSPVEFRMQPYDPGRQPKQGVYWAPAGCPTMRVGDRLRLRVETMDGNIVTGVTRVPGMRGAFLLMQGDSIEMGGGDSVGVFNRDHDILKLGVDAVAGRLLQLDVRRNADLADYGTKVQADTTEFLLAGDAVDVYVSGEGNDVFLGGRSYALTLTLSDTNYYDFSRSSNNEFTGRGFINHLTGGMGVFGSAVSATSRVWVVADIDDPREGLYRVSGEVGNISVDFELRIFLHRQTDVTGTSAFMEGVWFRRGPGGRLGPAWDQRDFAGKSIDGTFIGEQLHLVVADTVWGSTIIAHKLLDGILSAADSSPLVVADSTMFGAAPFDTLWAVRR